MPVSVFESIVDALSGSSWSYLIVFSIAMLDAFIPIVPSETVAITAGVLASSGDLSVLVSVLAAAGGAFVGDNISYGIGHFFGERTVNRFFSGEKAKVRIKWAENQLEVRGSYIITVARFIPGGRTATTFTAGYVEFPWRKFLLFDAIAASIWGSYTVLLGYFGGSQFEDQPWKGLLLAFAIALSVTGLIEAVRYLRHRRQAARAERGGGDRTASPE
jgi:membrane protein DedA with SNARE-associated domain